MDSEVNTGDRTLAARVAAQTLGEEPSAPPQHIATDRGVFSNVFRVELPSRSVVVKLPRQGPNGDAARASGAYERERIAYLKLVEPGMPVPACFGVVDLKSGPAFVLEDLTDHLTVDQIEGLKPTQALAVVDAIVDCQQRMSVERALGHGVRTVAPMGFDPQSLRKGLSSVFPTAGFQRLLHERVERISTFAELPEPVVCHGDPRADNLVLGPGVRLFDWQQIAVQAGEADVAWLAATSTEPRIRRSCEIDLVERYAVRMERSFDEAWHRYRMAMVVPGLAVLLLAQRRARGRLQRLVEVSIDRIAIALDDHL